MTRLNLILLLQELILKKIESLSVDLIITLAQFLKFKAVMLVLKMHFVVVVGMMAWSKSLVVWMLQDLALRLDMSARFLQ